MDSENDLELVPRERGEDLNAATRYAWGWYSYHAGQRLVEFRFFLVVVGLVIAAYLKCYESGWTVFGIALSFLGTVISAAFLLLDTRNEELVNCGREALDARKQNFTWGFASTTGTESICRGGSAALVGSG